jgi:ribose transport system ATP-binding protein
MVDADPDNVPTPRHGSDSRTAPAAGQAFESTDTPSRDGALTEPFLRMEGIVKHFPGAKALDGVDLDVLPGEVHCLLGQNGAGKSTLIKVLSGAHQPTAGRILVDDTEVSIPHPVAALGLGVATVYQELDVVDGLTVAVKN